MRTSIPACVLGLTTATLSAWRDDALNPAEALRIESHVVECRACQLSLSDYETIAQALRSERPPVPDERLWRDIQTAKMPPGGRSRGRLARGPGSIWKHLGAVAAVLLLVAGFAEVLHLRAVGQSPINTATGTPTATPATMRAAPLRWQLVTLPAGSHTFAPAPSDGNIAYACAAQKGTPPHAWVTHDRAAHWGPPITLPTTRTDITGCTLVVDDLNAATAMVTVSWAPLGAAVFPADQLADYATFDAGAHWQRVGVTQQYIPMHLTTWQGHTYGLLLGAAGESLWVSNDQMRTWQPIDRQFTAAHLFAWHFWVDPIDGAILAGVSPGGVGVKMNLWGTHSNGTTWTELPVPPMDDFFAQVSGAGGSWRICGASTDMNAPLDPQPNTLTCSTDDGQTWTALPGLNLPVTRIGPKVFVPPVAPLVIAGDGSVLALVSPAPAPQTEVYRLLPNASQWQSLGMMPGDDTAIQYCAGPGAGFLWAINGGETFMAAYP